MSAPKNGFDSFTDHSAMGFIFVIAVVLFVVFPPILLVFVIIGCLVLIFKCADWREDRSRRKSREP